MGRRQHNEIGIFPLAEFEGAQYRQSTPVATLPGWPTVSLAPAGNRRRPLATLSKHFPDLPSSAYASFAVASAKRDTMA
jgi:hypothetical protein